MPKPPDSSFTLPPGVDDTPAMRQYFRFKQQHPQCVLFFRIGDFYELFYDDAKLVAKVLNLTLTQRTEGVPMAGMPFHSVETYLRRMIQAGYRVAVCDQVEDAALAKGVVKRQVTRVITPGTLTDESLLEEGAENPLAALVPGEGGTIAVAWAELSTGAFSLACFGPGELADELARIRPRELLYPETDGALPPQIKALAQSLSCAPAARPAWQFRRDEAVETLRRQFQVATLEGFGLTADDPALGPAAAIVHYLLETQKTADGGTQPAGRIPHLKPPRRFQRHEHLVIDQISLRSLEIERTIRSESTQGSLLGVLQDCRTAMGKRLLRQVLCYPLRDRAGIEARQRVVGALVEDHRLLEELRQALDQVQDVSRMMARIAVGRASPRDLVALGKSSAQATVLARLLAERPAVKGYWQRLDKVAAALAQLAQEIAAACVDTPPGHLRDGGLFRDGFDAQLDEFRGLQRDSNSWLARYQKDLIEQTGITSLKVGFNKIFGFYIELTASNKDKAPIAWSRKQTLKNAERFTTPQLKEYEGKVLSAEQRAVAREQELFIQFCARAQEEMEKLHLLADTAAQLDVLACFARRAIRFRYVRPLIVDEPVLAIKAGRHPVLDELLGDRFVPNDVELGRHEGKKETGTEGALEVKHEGAAGEEEAPDDAPSLRASVPSCLRASASGASLALITGPNMAGKSTYIRQTALIVLLAHTGSFVPAEAATIGLCDRIFTRVGASDELHAGASTFMVEMTETANLCHHATPASLVILDEIGRGTSTLDGLALAWAIAEHLASRGCRTLFATHYHELTTLADHLPAVTNLNVTVREWQDQVVFLHRIAPGRTDRSYGIHVAKIAGLPEPVVQRARQVLGQLEVSHNGGPAAAPAASGTPTSAAEPNRQLSLFTEYLDHPALTELRQLDLTRLTPLEAFDALRRLREQARPTST